MIKQTMLINVTEHSWQTTPKHMFPISLKMSTENKVKGKKLNPELFVYYTNDTCVKNAPVDIKKDSGRQNDVTGLEYHVTWGFSPAKLPKFLIKREK